MCLLLLLANEVCESNVFTGVCLSMGGSLSSGGSLSKGGVSVQGGLCLGGSLSGYIHWGVLCPGWVSVQGGLCQGTPPYSKERAVCILLECILVKDEITFDQVGKKYFDIFMELVWPGLKKYPEMQLQTEETGISSDIVLYLPYINNNV